jgi:hypothetical protein
MYTYFGDAATNKDTQKFLVNLIRKAAAENRKLRRDAAVQAAWVRAASQQHVWHTPYWGKG